jgi:mono/diheme cytochrome c family protein
VTLASTACGRPDTAEHVQAVAAFATVQQVFQHPRCQDCHIPGDAPLQFDAGVPHAMAVARGPDGHGAPGLSCATCHGQSNPPASYGSNAPPGAPHWGLPPPDHKMTSIGLSSAALCEMIKDKRGNGGRERHHPARACRAAARNGLASAPIAGRRLRRSDFRQTMPHASARRRVAAADQTAERIRD